MEELTLFGWRSAAIRLVHAGHAPPGITDAAEYSPSLSPRNPGVRMVSDVTAAPRLEPFQAVRLAEGERVMTEKQIDDVHRDGFLQGGPGC